MQQKYFYYITLTGFSRLWNKLYIYTDILNRCNPAANDEIIFAEMVPVPYFAISQSSMIITNS